MIWTILFSLLALFLLIWNISLLVSVIYGAPTVYASNKTILQAFKLAGLKSGQTVVDLGCGNARALIIASKHFNAKGIGIEISPFYFCLAKLNVLLNRRSDDIKIVYGNLRNSKKLIPQADIVYLYLFGKIVKEIESDIFGNAKKGSKIISLGFEFINHKHSISSHKPLILIYFKK